MERRSCSFHSIPIFPNSKFENKSCICFVFPMASDSVAIHQVISFQYSCSVIKICRCTEDLLHGQIFNSWSEMMQVMSSEQDVRKGEYIKIVLCLVAQSCQSLCNPMDSSHQSPLSMGILPGKNIEMGCHSLLQEIFPIQGSNPGLLHCKQILFYHLSHRGSPYNYYNKM